MSIFGRSTFSAASYAAFRPSYPQSLFRKALAFHNPASKNGTLLDLGCGHGLIAREFSPHFGRVFGVDPSAGMVKQAAEMTAEKHITFRQGSAEDLSFLDDGSVDMVTIGQAAHWFDYRRAWPELGRVVKKGGSLVIWGYKDNIIVGYPAANRVFDQAVYGEGEVKPGMESLNRYWERPGRDIIRDLLRVVKPPEEDWVEVVRDVYEPDREVSTVGDADKGWLRKRLKLGEFEGYVRTFSSYRGWRDAHPDVKSRAEGGEGDVIDIMFDKMLEVVPEWKSKGDGWRDVEVDSVWASVVIMARRV